MNKYKVTYLIAHKTPWERKEVKVITANDIEEAERIAYQTAPFYIKHRFIKVRRIFRK